MKPIFRTPEHYNVDRIGKKLARNGFYCIDSDVLAGVMYAYNDSEIAVVTGQSGVIRLSLNRALKLGAELKMVAEYIQENRKDIDARRICG